MILFARVGRRQQPEQAPGDRAAGADHLDRAREQSRAGRRLSHSASALGRSETVVIASY
jgi:hypothetical protein